MDVLRNSTKSGKKSPGNDITKERARSRQMNTHLFQDKIELEFLEMKQQKLVTSWQRQEQQEIHQSRGLAASQ